MKKCWEVTQTLHAGCSKAEQGGAKKFCPQQTHCPGAPDHQSLISWRWSLKETRRTSTLLATEQPWPQYILLQNLGREYTRKMQDVNDLRRHLIDAWVGVKHRVIDDGIHQWHRCLHAYTRATRGHFQYSSRHKLCKTLLTSINSVKINC